MTATRADHRNPRDRTPAGAGVALPPTVAAVHPR
jgi:hypothetical protein